MDPSEDDSSSGASLYAGSRRSESPDLHNSLPKYLASSIQEALYSAKLDQCLALQAKTSGMLNARYRALEELNVVAKEQLRAIKNEFPEGMKLAKATQAELTDLQRRIRACEELAKQQIPAQYQASADKFRRPDNSDD